MRIKLQLVMCSDDGREETITDLVTLQKDAQRIEHLGLTLREAKQLLNMLQKRLLHHQVDAFLDGSSTCPVAYLLAADNVSRLPPSRLRGVNQLVIRTLNGCSSSR